MTAAIQSVKVQLFRVPQAEVLEDANTAPTLVSSW